MALPYIKFYPGDYLRDTRHFTAEQHGAYLLLLMVQWQDGYLPTKPAVLARMAGIEPERWRYVGKAVMEKFDIIDGRYMQKRMAADRVQAGEKLLKLANNGRAGGKAKALKNNKPDLANAKQMLKQTGDGVIDSPHTQDSVGKDSELVGVGWECEFAAFYQLYPKRQNRPRAMAAYFNARQRGHNHAEIICSLPRWTEAWRGQSEQFIPNPAAWLDGDRFLDQPPMVTPAASRNWALDAKEAYLKGMQERDERDNIIDLQARKAE